MCEKHLELISWFAKGCVMCPLWPVCSLTAMEGWLGKKAEQVI